MRFHAVFARITGKAIKPGAKPLACRGVLFIGFNLQNCRRPCSGRACLAIAAVLFGNPAHIAQRTAQDFRMRQQSWFAGVHCNIGGGYPDAGLSDDALIWMIARIQALTGLEFDLPSVKTVTGLANVNGEIYDSSKGWIIDEIFPHGRSILSPDAIDHGIFFNTPNRNNEHINERIHWSVLKKLGQPCTVCGVKNTPYKPSNMAATIPPDKIAT